MRILSQTKRLAYNLLCESNCYKLKAITGPEFSKCATATRLYGKDHKYPDSTQQSTVVYKGNLTGMIKATKFFSLSSSLMGLISQPYLVKAASSFHPAVIACAGVVVFVFTYITPIALHWIIRKYITELRFDPETQTFECNTLTFLSFNKKLNFKASDVTIPDVPGIFTTFEAKGKPLFVDVRQFIDVDAYRHLMGYDKPLDLHLKGPEENNKST